MNEGLRISRNKKSELRWKLREIKETPIQFVPIDKRIEYLLRSIFGESEDPVDLDEILSHLYISLKGTYLPDNQEILNVLEKVGEPVKIGKIYKWKKRTHKITQIDEFIPEEEVEAEEIEICWEHLRLILQVAELGIKLGYNTWIGKTEKRKDKRLINWSTIKQLEYPQISKRTLERIAEIDCIWFENGFIDKLIEIEARDYSKCILRITNIFEENLPEELLPQSVKIIFIIRDGMEQSFLKTINTPSVKGLIVDKIKRSIYYITFSKFLEIKDESDYITLSQSALIRQCNKFEAIDVL